MDEGAAEAGVERDAGVVQGNIIAGLPSGIAARPFLAFKSFDGLL